MLQMEAILSGDFGEKLYGWIRCRYSLLRTVFDRGGVRPVRGTPLYMLKLLLLLYAPRFALQLRSMKMHCCTAAQPRLYRQLQFSITPMHESFPPPTTQKFRQSFSVFFGCNRISNGCNSLQPGKRIHTHIERL